MGVAGPQHAIGVGLESGFRESVLSLHPAGPGDKAQMVRLGGKKTYLDGHWEGKLVL